MRWRVKPSKPAALFGTVVGMAILVIGLTSFHRFSAFMVLWVLICVGIIAFNLWAAFSPRGSLYSINRPDDQSEPPGRY
jgi:hypothetical protein